MGCAPEDIRRGARDHQTEGVVAGEVSLGVALGCMAPSPTREARRLLQHVEAERAEELTRRSIELVAARCSHQISQER